MFTVISADLRLNACSPPSALLAQLWERDHQHSLVPDEEMWLWPWLRETDQHLAPAVVLGLCSQLSVNAGVRSVSLSTRAGKTALSWGTQWSLAGSMEQQSWPAEFHHSWPCTASKHSPQEIPQDLKWKRVRSQNRTGQQHGDRSAGSASLFHSSASQAPMSAGQAAVQTRDSPCSVRILHSKICSSSTKSVYFISVLIGNRWW